MICTILFVSVTNLNVNLCARACLCSYKIQYFHQSYLPVGALETHLYRVQCELMLRLYSRTNIGHWNGYNNIYAHTHNRCERAKQTFLLYFSSGPHKIAHAKNNHKMYTFSIKRPSIISLRSFCLFCSIDLSFFFFLSFSLFLSFRRHPSPLPHYLKKCVEIINCNEMGTKTQNCRYFLSNAKAKTDKTRSKKLRSLLQSLRGCS